MQSDWTDCKSQPSHFNTLPPAPSWLSTNDHRKPRAYFESQPKFSTCWTHVTSETMDSWDLIANPLRISWTSPPPWSQACLLRILIPHIATARAKNVIRCPCYSYCHDPHSAAKQKSRDVLNFQYHKPITVALQTSDQGPEILGIIACRECTPEN